jgi:hypothetical protein
VRRSRILIGVLLIICLLLVTSCQDLEQPESSRDSDGDGWSDSQEKIAGTDARKVDTDDDGYWDPHDPNPLNPDIPASKGLPKTTPQPQTTTAEPSPPEETEPNAKPYPSDSSSACKAVSPEAAAAEELRKVQDTVLVLMRNNNLTYLENPVVVPTNDMHRFPDTSTKHGIAGVGYVLFLHDFNGDGEPDSNYISLSFTKGTYTCDKHGVVTQVTTGYE